jgi:N-acetylglucosaminyl-diphospho-decaprenol L-rhamnosyltransferase
MPDLSILIVCYRSRRFIRDCLAGLVEHSDGFTYEILLTDNSDDGTAELVRTEFPNVRILEGLGNIGFAAGNNYLAHHAQSPRLLLLNPDTVIRDNAVGTLLEFASLRPDGGAWGGVTVRPDGGIDPGCLQTPPGVASALMYALGLGRYLDAHARRALEKTGVVASLSGAFMMVSRQVWEQLGGFDETFFMYNEEAELCYRIRRLGRPVLMTPLARIIHNVGGGSQMNPNRIVAMMRGRMHHMRKHQGFLSVWLVGGITWFHGLSRWLGALLGRPLIGPERARSLRISFAPVVFQPWTWWRGYGRQGG